MATTYQLPPTANQSARLRNAVALIPEIQADMARLGIKQTLECFFERYHDAPNHTGLRAATYFDGQVPADVRMILRQCSERLDTLRRHYRAGQFDSPLMPTDKAYLAAKLAVTIAEVRAMKDAIRQ